VRGTDKQWATSEPEAGHPPMRWLFAKSAKEKRDFFKSIIEVTTNIFCKFNLY